MKAFRGEGQRLDGKVRNNGGTLTQSGQHKLTVAEKPVRGIPNYNYRKGKITFVKAKNIRSVEDEPMVSTYIWMCVCHWYSTVSVY